MKPHGRKKKHLIGCFLLAQFCVAKPVACRWAIKRTRKKRRSFLLHTFLPLRHAEVQTTKPVGSHKREPPFGWLSFGACRFLQSKNQSCQRRFLIERAGENRQRCPLHTFLFWRYAGARTTNLWAATKSRLKCASLFAQSGIKNALLRILPEKGRRGA